MTDASAATSIATGTSSARSLAARAADHLHVRDFGAAGNGSANDAAAFTAAASPFGLIDLSRATYALAAAPALPNMALRGQAAGFSGAYPRSIVDGTALAVSNDWLAAEFNAAGATGSGSANQHLQHLSLYNSPSSSAGNYEKTAQYIRVMQADASNGATVQRDLVGQQITAQLATGVATGRIFGQHIWAEAQAGSDGLVVGKEIELYDNSGTVQGAVDTVTSKYGLHMVAAAGTPTVGIMLRTKDGTAKWGTGVYAQAAALDTSFLRIDNQFLVTKDGRIGIGTVTPGFTVGLTYVNPTADARIVLETGGAATATYQTYRNTGIRAYSHGLDCTTGEFRITGTEGMAASMLFRSTTVAMAFFGNAPYVSPGWVMPAGGRSKAAYDPQTVTLPILAAYVASIADALSGYGLLRP